MATAVKRAGIAIVLAVVAASALSCASPRPSLRFKPGVPQDVQALTEVTWERFLAAFPGRADCIAPVRVAVAWGLGSPAEYDPVVGLVTVRVPGTAPNLEASLLHEFAHHLDFTCERIGALRVSFLAAQGFAPNAPWFRGTTWETTPSEQYAEAVSELVLGGRPPHPRVVLREGALEVIRTWASGG